MLFGGYLSCMVNAKSFLADWIQKFPFPMSHSQIRHSQRHFDRYLKIVFKKDCLHDKTCQFSASQGTPWQSYLENLAIDDKFIKKQVRIFIHQTCV